ncbi:MAG TPA: hypothetical protein GX005_00450 [Bacteroidales bacterium]|nr:hypothetical protein [Bacteroidales bacterium]
MKNVRQKYKASSPIKKVLSFNAYSLLLAVIFFALSLLIYSLFDSYYDEIPLSETFIMNLNNITLYIVSIVWSYIMVALALFSNLFYMKAKK